MRAGVSLRDLNQEGFARLLAHLDPDPERAGGKYEALRHKLIVFFEGRSCGFDSDSLADRTLDRVAGKLSESIDIQATLSGYCYGVARFIWQEWRRERRHEPLDHDPPAPPTGDEVAAIRHHCLEGCLGGLAPESRKLILDYYEGERSGKIENRARQAEYLSITPNALRRRAHLIRVNVLEPCLKKCVEEGPKG